MSQNNSTKGLASIIAASSVGTLIEWYDFYIFGSLAPIISTKFFPASNPAFALIGTLATFAAGFVVRPFGALFFGRLGDLIGRKYTFMVTLLLMGVSTFLIGLIPDYSKIGVAAPLVVLLLRLLQGLALGGEYGGAATYVAEHSPVHKRGFWTSWIQTTATIGLFISLLVIYITKKTVGKEVFNDWGWRIPFLISIIMVAISYFIRKGMHESPLFVKAKAEGKTAVNPLKESFGNKYNFKFVLLALLGITMGQGVVWYTGQFYVMNFMKGAAAIEADQVESVITWGLIYATPLFVVFATLSDKIGRKWIMLGGMFLAVICYRPIFRNIYATVDLSKKTEIVDSTKNVTATTVIMKEGVATADSLSTTKIHKVYTDGTIYDEKKETKILADKTVKADPPKVTKAKLINDSAISHLTLMVFVLMIFVTMAYGPIAAYLVELFPTKIRYTSMSLPYHIGNGVFGGLLPAIAAILATASKTAFDKAKETGDAVAMATNAEHYLAGLWYPIIIAGICFVIGAVYLKETVNTDKQHH